MATSSCQIFKIMAEFIEGIETLAKIRPYISIFGSARHLSGNPHYELTVEIVRKRAMEEFASSSVVDQQS
jgi:hypothetical protein